MRGGFRRVHFVILISAILALGFTAQSSAGLPTADGEGRPLPSLAPMLKGVNPAVVNIATYSTLQQRNNPLLNDPFFRHFFNIPDSYRQPQAPQKRQQSAGSGVIVNARDGIVITNFHVIKDADEVQVSLVDGRAFAAKVMGTDPDLDIAVLYIDAKDLAEVPMADSNELLVGDFVVAIGNPFGLGQTVTTGVVSALGRSGLGIEGYENFIQTDASINPGNSGGALVNLRGELVGINTAIIAPAGGNVGIGFAIPVNMARASLDQIVTHGEVRRGQVGIGIQDITPDLRRAFKLENGIRGVLITHVEPGSHAEDAGVQAGDIITHVNGEASLSSAQLRSLIGMVPVGKNVKVTLVRNGNEKTMKVKVGEVAGVSGSRSRLHPLLEGATFEASAGKEYVRVAGLAPRSIAAQSGLRLGDIVVSVNQVRVVDMRSFKRALSKSDDSILVHISRNGGSFYLVIR